MQVIKDLDIKTAIATEKIYENIEANRDKRLQAHKGFDWRSGSPISIVGGGPSLKDTIHELGDFGRIIACGSVHDYLIMNGVHPDWCVICDPDPLVINYLKRKSPQTRYLIASQCDPSVYEHLKDQSVYTWHAYAEIYKQEVFNGHRQVIGGCTVGTRAMGIALAMGFDNLHLFGFDSCLTDDYKHHAYDFVDPSVETLGNITEIFLDPASGKKYKVAEFMLAQLIDFQRMLKIFATRMEITVHGDGLLKDLMDMGKVIAKELQNGDQSKFNGPGHPAAISGHPS